MCVECGSDNTHLCEQISPSVLKLSQCTSCEAVVDKYIEYDGVLVLLEMLLLKTNVYRHVVFNRRYFNNLLGGSGLLLWKKGFRARSWRERPGHFPNFEE